MNFVIHQGYLVKILFVLYSNHLARDNSKKRSGKIKKGGEYVGYNLLGISIVFTFKLRPTTCR